MQTYGADQFIGQIADVALAVLPYIGGAVVAGIAIYGLTWALRVAFSTVFDVAPNYDGPSGYQEKADGLYYNGAFVSTWEDLDGDEPIHGT